MQVLVQSCTTEVHSALINLATRPMVGDLIDVCGLINLPARVGFNEFDFWNSKNLWEVQRCQFTKSPYDITVLVK